ncbi:DUF456 domain-containing protein [Flectobacillus roseus]|uniref:DUF456 domain-containing protein n=1 Tax=Flectobacillus roseus TaxID=502259 RepID=UPI0024B74D7B|nr:DUF456 domain-containing protein [Flectobacillus roseus]MDI9872362.1 DUF456 domain-containing protein [Flectobacillus roseus]
MDIILTILAIGLLLGGLAGAVLPIPGPPLSLAGMFCLHYTRFVEFNKSTLVVFTVLTVAMAIFDYYAPVWGTKKFGGSKYGAIGSTVGLLIGMFFIPAVGMLLGAFLGALIGELINGADFSKALKAAIGSFIGLITGMVGKIALCLAMLLWSGFALGEYIMIMFF